MLREEERETSGIGMATDRRFLCWVGFHGVGRGSRDEFIMGARVLEKVFGQTKDANTPGSGVCELDQGGGELGINRPGLD